MKSGLVVAFIALVIPQCLAFKRPLPIFHQLCPDYVPTLYAVIEYDPVTKETSFDRPQLNLPPVSPCPDPRNNVYRIGKFDDSTKTLIGSGYIIDDDDDDERLLEKYRQIITLFLDSRGDVYSIDLRLDKTMSAKEEPLVQLVKMDDSVRGLRPVSLKRVVDIRNEAELGEDQEIVEEKTFLQKYGLMIAGVVVFMILNTVNGQKESEGQQER